ncbi:MAG: preprotein translocase subunit YajC [Pirellulales bacterium]
MPWLEVTLRQALVLAQAAPAGGGTPAGGAPAPGQGGTSPLMQMAPMLVAMFLLFYVLLIRPQRKEQKTRQLMLENIKKNDRVVTIGGIYGTVTSVRREADEITIKVDDSTKLRVTVSSVSRVLGAETTESKPATLAP